VTRKVICPTSPTEGAHAWDNTGLDVIDTKRLRPAPAESWCEVLCSTRICIYCRRVEAKPYGDGGRKPWREVVPVTHGAM